MGKNILLTSVGGLTGTYLSKYYKRFPQFRVIGADMSDEIASMQWLDRFYKISSAKDIEEYERQLVQIIETENIHYIIPTASYDMNAFTKSAFLSQMKDKMLIMDRDMHIHLHNKKQCYQFLEKLTISVPQIYTEKVCFPCILKPEEGTGSKNTIKLDDKVDLDYWKNKVDNFLLMEYLEGDEYTVDCLFDREGENIGFNVRKRKKTNGGGVVVTQNTHLYDKQVSEIIHKLEALKRIKGPVNFQFKEKNEELVIFDFNTRFASGGLPLTVKSGFEIPYLLLELIDNNQVVPWISEEKTEGLTMIRYYEEVYRCG